MIYTLCKKKITKGDYEYNAMLMKLDAYLLGDRITPDQYNELKGLMDAAKNIA